MGMVLYFLVEGTEAFMPPALDQRATAAEMKELFRIEPWRRYREEVKAGNVEFTGKLWAKYPEVWQLRVLVFARTFIPSPFSPLFSCLQLRVLVDGMLSKKPGERPTIKAILNQLQGMNPRHHEERDASVLDRAQERQQTPQVPRAPRRSK